MDRGQGGGGCGGHTFSPRRHLSALWEQSSFYCVDDWVLLPEIMTVASFDFEAVTWSKDPRVKPEPTWTWKWLRSSGHAGFVWPLAHISCRLNPLGSLLWHLSQCKHWMLWSAAEAIKWDAQEETPFLGDRSRVFICDSLVVVIGGFKKLTILLTNLPRTGTQSWPHC